MRLKWIKLPCDIYFSPKLRLLSDCECGSIYQLIYIYMLCLSGKSGEGGVLRLSSGKPYDAAMLARIFDIDKATVERALRKMTELDLISQSKNALIITDWSDLQFLDEMPIEEAEERSDRNMPLSPYERLKRYREKQKHLRTKMITNDNGDDNSYDNEMITNDNANDNGNDNGMITQNPYKYISLDKNKNKNISEYIISEKDKEKETSALSAEEEEFLFLSCCEQENKFPFDNERSRAGVNSKDSYGELRNVYLTESEHEAFKNEFPLDFSERIDELSLYMASSGKEYCDHYATLKSFSKRRISPDVQRHGGAQEDASLGLYSARRSKAEPQKPRYGDFDPEQAMRDAILRSESEFE